MGHELRSKSGPVATAADVVGVLRSTFSHVEVDETEGAKAAASKIAWIEKSPPRLFLGRHEEALAYARRLRALKPGEAVVVRFGDDRRLLATAIVMPEEPICFGYASAAEERALLPLISRLAAAMGAELVEF